MPRDSWFKKKKTITVNVNKLLGLCVHKSVVTQIEMQIGHKKTNKKNMQSQNFQIKIKMIDLILLHCQTGWMPTQCVEHKYVGSAHALCQATHRKCVGIVNQLISVSLKKLFSSTVNEGHLGSVCTPMPLFHCWSLLLSIATNVVYVNTNSKWGFGLRVQALGFM